HLLAQPVLELRVTDQSDTVPELHQLAQVARPTRRHLSRGAEVLLLGVREDRSNVERLAEGQLTRVRVEVVPRGWSDPINPRRVLDHVEIEFHELLFAEL